MLNFFLNVSISLISYILSLKLVILLQKKKKKKKKKENKVIEIYIFVNFTI